MKHDEQVNVQKRKQFESELCDLINKFSMENDSNTPDFILASYLSDCLVSFNRMEPSSLLDAFGRAIVKRNEWYDR